MTQLGEFITVKVNPDDNGGLEEAPALVTGVYEDGSLRLRVFGAGITSDTERNYAGDDGEPFDADAHAERQAERDDADRLEAERQSSAAQGVPPSQPVEPAQEPITQQLGGVSTTSSSDDGQPSSAPA